MSLKENRGVRLIKLGLVQCVEIMSSVLNSLGVEMLSGDIQIGIN